MSWDMYIPYAVEVGILLLRWGKLIILKLEIISFVIDSGNKMTACVKSRYRSKNGPDEALSVFPKLLVLKDLLMESNQKSLNF